MSMYSKNDVTVSTNDVSLSLLFFYESRYDYLNDDENENDDKNENENDEKNDKK
jgi:hypothetical protein